jgi:pilus assembly protein CpaE
VAQNLAWTVAREHGTATVIADLDVAFGTASLNFNQDPRSVSASKAGSVRSTVRSRVAGAESRLRLSAHFESRRSSISADEILIVAPPDLAGLRNVKNLLALLHQQRPNDARARVVLNGVQADH